MPTQASGLTVDVSHDFSTALGEGDARQALISPEEWDSLLHSSVSDVVFLTWQWQQLWWKHFGAPEGCKLHLLALRDEGGALVGIAPLFVAHEPLPHLKEYAPGVLRPVGEGTPQRLVRIVGGIEVADYLDVIAPEERLRPVWSAVLDYLLSCRDEWDAIDLHSLPEWSPSRDLIAELAGERGLKADIVAEDACPVLPLPDDFETYLMSLRKKDRHELRRKVRKLESREDVHWYLVPSNNREAMSEKMHIFLDLHRKSGVDKAHFMNDQMAAFFFEMGDTLTGTGWLDLSLLEIDGQPASAYFAYNYKERLYLYNSGYDPAFASYSAGVALLAYRIHKAINQGLRQFDFLRGDEPYKYDFGAENTCVYRALIREE